MRSTQTLSPGVKPLAASQGPSFRPTQLFEDHALSLKSVSFHLQHLYIIYSTGTTKIAPPTKKSKESVCVKRAR